MRYQFYKVRLRFEKTTLPVTVACYGIEKLQETLESSMALYTSMHGQFYGMVVDDTKITAHMPEDQYQEELSYCDITQPDNLEGRLDMSKVQVVSRRTVGV